MVRQPGRVALVGAGPGDPGLLTVRGRELLERCDALVYDALANPALLDLAPPGAERHDVGKRGGDADSARQEEINALLVRLGRTGKRVVRLKGGDSFVFGRGSEEAQALAAAGIPFEVVPGVTAGIAAPACAGIPVTHRGVATSVTFVTGHEDPAKGAPTVDWSALARAGGTIVLYMGVKSLPRITSALIDGGLDPATPAAAIRWGTYPQQRTVTATLATLVADVAAAQLTAPVITVIGAVVSLRDTIGWFERRPLFGRRILVTRAEPGAGRSSLGARLADAGADVVTLPTTRLELLDAAPLRAAIAGLGAYGWVVFTSQNAVRLFWDALRAAGRDARALARAKVAAVGPATASALLEHGLAVDVTPPRFVAEGVLDALAARADVRGTRVLYAAAEGARDVLPAGLAALGATVERVPLYRSVPDEALASALRDALASDDAPIDMVSLASASAVRAYVDAAGESARRIPVASIGPVTTAAARAAGLEVAAEAEESTMDGLALAMMRYFEQTLATHE